MTIGEFYTKYKTEIFVLSFVLIMIGLEKIIPSKSVKDPGPGNYGSIKVEYLIGNGELVPYEPVPDKQKGLWEPNTKMKFPSPRTPDFKTSISRADMSNATGYTGGCELPKIVRESTNSAFCLECHEQHGVVNPTSMPITPENSHPMGSDVPWGTTGYQQMQNTKLVMVDGVMACTTCHDFWATPVQPNWVAVPGNICTECHDK